MDPTVGTGEQRSVLWTAIRGVPSLSQLCGGLEYRQRLLGRAVGSAGNTAERLMCPPNWNAPCLPVPWPAAAVPSRPVAPYRWVSSQLIACPRRTTSGLTHGTTAQRMRTNPAITHMPPPRDSRFSRCSDPADERRQGHSWSELLLGTRTRSVACAHTHAHAQGHASHSSRVSAQLQILIAGYARTVQYMRREHMQPQQNVVHAARQQFLKQRQRQIDNPTAGCSPQMDSAPP